MSSNPFGKTATEIMSYLLEHTSESINEKAVRKLIGKSANAKSDEIIAAIKGYSIETDQVKKLKLRIKPYFEFVEFISVMPGMTELSSTIVLAETVYGYF